MYLSQSKDYGQGYDILAMMFWTMPSKDLKN